MSRGRGISIADELPSILRKLHTRDYRLVVQRYVERPLLIHKRKFDIRQWVLVTSVNPLVVWSYTSYYLRFCSVEYVSADYNSADYRAIHLTNQSVQKHVEGYGAVEGLESNMWSRRSFHEYLAATHGEEDGAGIAASIEAQIRRAIGVATRSVCDIVEHRRNSFELFGFDFMVDADHRVWLLEANSSPDMSRNAAPLRAIVDDGLDDLLQLVLDLKRGRLPVAKLVAERQARAGPCWRIAYRGKALTARELQRRRLTKKFSMDAPGGNSSVFKGLSHVIALRPWLAVIGAAARAAIEEPIKPNDL